jgi:hypothetical protein
MLKADDHPEQIVDNQYAATATNRVVASVEHNVSDSLKSKRFSQVIRQTLRMNHSSDKLNQEEEEEEDQRHHGIHATMEEQERIESKHIHDSHGDDSWQARVLHLLHSNKVKFTLLGLLVLDVFILFIELAVAAFFPTCTTVEKTAISCGPLESNTTTFHEYSYSCDKGFPNLAYPATCDPEKRHVVDIVEDTLFGVTVFILGVFFVELTTVMLLLGPCTFIKDWLHAIDYVVVCVSLGLEIAFQVESDAVLQAIIGLLIFGRLWRFIRIGHGVYEASKQVLHDKLEKVLLYLEQLENLLEMHGIALPEHDVFDDDIKHSSQAH